MVDSDGTPDTNNATSQSHHIMSNSGPEVFIVSFLGLSFITGSSILAFCVFPIYIGKVDNIETSTFVV